MGEVYKARDSRLDRTVAIKVLPEHVASDPDLQQRFEREAKTISSLNHPNICTLYDVGEHEGTTFLVMEYLEGDTLAARLAKGPVPVDQALQIAVEIASALDKAHGQGITHRDLKPSNIMLTQSGAKLLDFGLAKLRPADPAEGLTALSTQEAPLTEQGTILGTFQYMAPEQLEGQEADARTDIFAFGTLVYELVTGRKAFEGKSRASLIAAILERHPPPVSSLQTMSPAALDQIVKTCLAKDPNDRWQSAGDVGRQLRWIADVGAPAEPAAPTANLTGPPPAPRTTRERMLGALAGGVVAALVAGLAVWYVLRPVADPPTRLTVSVPGTHQVLAESPAPLALSPDGRTLVFVGCEGTCGAPEQPQLFRRPLDQLDTQPIPGTTGATSVFFLPDGQSVGFTTAQGVSTVTLTGGPAVRVFEGLGLGASVGSDGAVVVGGFPGQGLRLVASSGGEPRSLTTPAGAELHIVPEILPGGTAALFTIATGSADSSQVAVVSLETGEHHILIAGSGARFSPTGHVVFLQGGSLLAAPFDLDALEVTGAPVPILDRLQGGSWFGSSPFSVSADGSLAYLRGDAGSGVPESALVWVDRQGGEEPLAGPVDAHAELNLSPDGTQVAVGVESSVNRDLWVYDLARGARERLTLDAAVDSTPVWSPDGERVAFLSQREDGGILWKAADGTGDVERLMDAPLSVPLAFSPDGMTLVFQVFNPASGSQFDLGVLSLDGDRASELIVDGEFMQVNATLSPDGRWLAYQSDESGRFEVYVRPFPEVERDRTLVSTNGGQTPVWGPGGRELFYVSPEGMTVVPIETEPRFAPGTAQVLFDTAGYALTEGPPRQFDIAPDGQRFLMLKPVAATDGGGAAPEIVLVLDWFDELRRLVPTP